VKTRRHNPRLVKIHRTYTVDEVARLFGNHKHTVRAWIKAGLPTCDSKRPTLILGSALRAFLQAKRAAHKKRCGPGEMYCLRCREPRTPALRMAEYKPVTDKLGNLAGICPVCEGMIYRRVSLPKIGQFRAELDITFPQAARHIGESSNPSLNVDFGKEGQARANA
jgi:hypothetical protein